jgi:hypothetical protein
MGLVEKSFVKELYNRTHDLDVEGISDYIFHEPRTRSNGRPPFTVWALYMDFETPQEAGAAKDRLHNLKLFGRRLHVRYAGLRLADGSTGTGTAKGSNLEAWEEEELRKKILPRKWREHLSGYDSPDFVIGLRKARTYPS